MLVKKILETAAALAGRRDLADYYAGKGGTDLSGLEADAEMMLRCFNLTENEVALDYIPIDASTRVISSGLIPFSDLNGAATEIIAVRDLQGKKLDFRLTEEGIVCRAGEVSVEYYRKPDVKKESDHTDFPNGERFLSFGTACEFSLMEGQFDRASALDVRYKDALTAARRDKSILLKERGWI